MPMFPVVTQYVRIVALNKQLYSWTENFIRELPAPKIDIKLAC